MDECTSSDTSWVCDLYHMGQMVAQEQSVDFALQKILEHLAFKLGAETGSLALARQTEERLELVAGLGLPDGVVGSEVPFGNGVLGWVARHGEPVLLNGDASEDPRFSHLVNRNPSSTPRSSMCWPLLAEERVIGVLSLNRAPGDEPFGQKDMDHAEIVLSHVTVVVQNARLHRKHQEQLDALAEANVRIALLTEIQGKFIEADKHIGEAGKLEEFFDEVIDDVAILTKAEAAGLVVFDDEHTQVREYINGDEAVVREIARKMATGGELHDWLRTADIGLAPVKEDETPILASPLRVEARTVGAIFLLPKRGGEAFNDNDELMLGVVGNDLTLLLERLDLLRQLRATNTELVKERAEQQALIDKLQEAQQQLLQSEKLASIGQLAAGVAHEINNPVGYINSNIGTLRQYIEDLFRLIDCYEQTHGVLPEGKDLHTEIMDLRDELDMEFLRQDIVDLIGESVEGVTRVKQIVQDLKDFSHVDRGEWEQVDLHKGIDSTLNIVHNEVKYKAEVNKEYGDLPLVNCLPSQLNQVFMNLLVNAAHAIEDRGTITIRTGSEGDMVWVEVEDSGCGIEEDKVKKIFDPFFTTKEVGKGTGLGLSLSYGIVQKHQGRIEVNSEVGVGTRFRVWVPVAPGQESETDEQQPLAATAG